MNHDPLCPTDQNLDPACWFCDLIAKVRADEREQAATRMYLQREHMRADLRAQVEALPWIAYTAPAEGFVLRDDVLALLDGGSE